MRERFTLALTLWLAAAVTGRADAPAKADPAALPLLRQLKEGDAATRADAALAPGRLGPKAGAAAPALAAALKAAAPTVRGRAAVALWRVDRPLKPVLPALLAARRDG